MIKKYLHTIINFTVLSSRKNPNIPRRNKNKKSKLISMFAREII